MKVKAPQLRRLSTDDSVRTGSAELTLRKSLYPVALVTVTFLLWGFSSSLIDTLNKHFQNTLGISRTRASGLQAAYYGAYPLASLGHANYILRNHGYKLTFVWGLCLYGIGALITWPCIVHRSFTGFCVAVFIIGNGLGSLEAAADPYITLCGPPRYAELRSNISQAFTGVGVVLAPLLGSYVFFLNTGEGEQGLRNLQWVYIAIAVFVFALAVVFLVSPLPEFTNADMAAQATMAHANTDAKPFYKQYRLFHAAFAQFCYVGAQVAIVAYFINYVTETRPGTDSNLGAKLLAGAQGCFTLGRFIGSFVMKFVRPRWVFLAFVAGCIAFTAPAITQRGNTGMSMLYVTLFFESVIFPTIIALGMLGLGKHTKLGSGFLVGGVAGGAVAPPLMGAVADMTNSTATAMSVPLAFFVVVASYALCVNFVKSYHDPTDRLGDAVIGIVTSASASHSDVEAQSTHGLGAGDKLPETSTRQRQMSLRWDDTASAGGRKWSGFAVEKLDRAGVDVDVDVTVVLESSSSSTVAPNTIEHVEKQ